MKEYKRITQQIGLVGITNLFLRLSGIILLPILTKNLPIEEYGIWAQAIVTIELIPLLITFGLPYSMVRFLAAEKKKKEIQEFFSSILTIVLLSSLLVCSFIYLFSKPIASVLFGNAVVVVKVLAVIIIFECLILFFKNYFRTFRQIKKFSFFELFRIILRLLLASYFVLSGYGVFYALVGVFIANAITSLFMFSIIIYQIGLKIPRFTNIRNYLGFGLPTVPGNLSRWIVRASDRYLISIFMGLAFVGYYTPGYTLGGIIALFFAPLALILPSVLSKYYDEGNIKGVKVVLGYSLRYFLLLAIPSVFGLSLLSKPILEILSTQEIASNGYLITPFVATSMLLFGCYTILVQVIVLNKKTKIIGGIWIIAAIINFGLNLFFIPYIGILGAAIATLTAYSFAFILTIFYVIKFFKFQVDLSFILKSIFSSIIISVVIVIWDPVGILHILGAIVVCIIIYSSILLMTKGFKKEEILFFKELFKV